MENLISDSNLQEEELRKKKTNKFANQKLVF